MTGAKSGLSLINSRQLNVDTNNLTNKLKFLLNYKRNKFKKLPDTSDQLLEV